MKIALDVFGGDNAPYSNIKGAYSYLKENKYDSNKKIILVGDKSKIISIIKELHLDKSKVIIEDAPDIIQMHERSSRLFKEKPNSSLVASIRLVSEGIAQAALSAGNTGALLSSSLFLIGKISGIKRPALAPYIPSNKGGFILCDAGANADSKPQHLLQFAIMAEAYLELYQNISNPRIALLNIGVEKGKGNDLTISSYNLMENNLVQLQEFI